MDLAPFRRTSPPSVPRAYWHAKPSCNNKLRYVKLNLIGLLTSPLLSILRKVVAVKLRTSSVPKAGWVMSVSDPHQPKCVA